MILKSVVAVPFDVHHVLYVWHVQLVISEVIVRCLVLFSFVV